MKAALQRRFGSPEVLEIADVPRPSPGQGQVLVKVRAASINSYDWHLLRADPVLVRLAEGPFRPRRQIPGADVAGTVEAVGARAEGFSPGDAVYGCLDSCGSGGFAEYVCAKASVLAPKPAGLSFEQAAAVPMAAVTALQGLRRLGGIGPGQRVAVNGASGGVGSFAVQIAKADGAEVTAVCSARNLGLAREMGADHVVDYAREDFTRSGRRYDLILDVAANHGFADYKRALTPQGICVVVGMSTLAHHALHVVAPKALRSRKDGQRLAMLMADNSKGADLLAMNGLLASGAVAPLVEAAYPLDRIREAFRRFEREHARGKLVITVQ
ncbi:MAG: NAD(P)-dependent alcohol dehydrogenase [Bifidobacteriaceae bacterium]|jgi:NADPH:quinone reductase-like Zn-dependent oxidoreductase|nr:NAD(P)-dependent alcohol dehydrogenase [Bifidobacteriaceae bacterium]